MQSAGVPTSLEPNRSRVAGSNPLTSASNRADTPCVLQNRFQLSDGSVTHCCRHVCVTYLVTAAATAGSAGEVCAAKIVAKNALRVPADYDFTPLVVESCGRQCSATHTVLKPLGRLATDSGRARARCSDRVIKFWVWNVSDSVRFICYVPGRRRCGIRA